MEERLLILNGGRAVSGDEEAMAAFLPLLPELSFSSFLLVGDRRERRELWQERRWNLTARSAIWSLALYFPSYRSPSPRAVWRDTESNSSSGLSFSRALLLSPSFLQYPRVERVGVDEEVAFSGRHAAR